MKILKFESKIIINKSVESIFQFLSKQKNHQHIFKANIECRQITEGPMRVGAEVVNTASFFGSKMKEHFEIIVLKKTKKSEKKHCLIAHTKARIVLL